MRPGYQSAIHSSIIPKPNVRTRLRALRLMLQQRSPLAALELFQRELGDIFQIDMPGFRPVMLVGAEACRFVMVTDRDNFRWRAEGEPITNLLRHGLLVEDGETHDRLRRSMSPALHRGVLAGYIESMGQLTDRVCSTWQDHQPYDMLVEMRQVAMLILMETLFEVDFGPDMSRMWPTILRTLSYISPGLWLLWRDIPRPGYKRALQQLDDYLFRIIRERRTAPGETEDLLGLLINDPELSDDWIRDQLLTMLIAGHDTSTALLAWVLYLLGRNPDIMARAQAELDTVLGKAPPSLETLSNLTYLEQIIDETLRLYPPIHLAMRIAATDLTFQGYQIPAGTRVLFSIYLTQRHERYWSRPGHFDPARFSPERRRAQPYYTYMPFGVGPRNCIGFAFARIEAKVVLARLLQQFEFGLISTKVHPHMGATLEPRPGMQMRVKRRT